MGEDTAQLRQEIDQTRRHMTMTADAIEDRVVPSRIIERRRNRIRAGLADARDRVMGVPKHLGDGLAGSGHSVRDEAGSVVEQVEHRAENNPFGAGILAFGVGMLAATLLPPTEPERQAGAKAREAGGSLREPMQEAAHELADVARSRGGEAVEAVKESGSEAAGNVTAAARERAQDTRRTAAEQRGGGRA
ncbi:MAG: DUF3618 domain-containing protein [Acidimicrobiia bacterium]